MLKDRPCLANSLSLFKLRKFESFKRFWGELWFRYEYILVYFCLFMPSFHNILSLLFIIKMNPYILVKRKSHNTQTKHAPYLYLCSLIACFCDAGLKIGTLRRTRVYLETLKLSNNIMLKQCITVCPTCTFLLFLIKNRYVLAYMYLHDTLTN
jgi:hypothetical protein